jgi:hypothetical protein
MKILVGGVAALLAAVCFLSYICLGVTTNDTTNFSELQSALTNCDDPCIISVSNNIYVTSTLQINQTTEIYGTESDTLLTTLGNYSIFSVESGMFLSLQYLHLSSTSNDLESNVNHYSLTTNVNVSMDATFVYLEENANMNITECQFSNGTGKLCIYTYPHVCICSYIHTCIHTYIHT